MSVAQFRNISDLKRQPTAKKASGLGGFPQPMRAQMESGMKKGMKKRVRFPSPRKK